MNRFIGLLNEDDKLVSDFWTSFLPVLRYILFAIIALCAITMIVTTLMQSNDSSDGMDAFTGAKQESYYSLNKGASRDAILKRITIAMAIVVAVAIVLFFVSELIAGLK